MKHVNSRSHNGYFSHQAQCTPYTLKHAHKVSAFEWVNLLATSMPRLWQREAGGGQVVQRWVGAGKEEEKDEGDNAKISCLWESGRWPHAGCHLGLPHKSGHLAEACRLISPSLLSWSLVSCFNISKCLSWLYIWLMWADMVQRVQLCTQHVHWC